MRGVGRKLKLGQEKAGHKDIGSVWNLFGIAYAQITSGKKQNNPAKRFDYQPAYLERQRRKIGLLSKRGSPLAFLKTRGFFPLDPFSSPPPPTPEIWIGSASRLLPPCRRPPGLLPGSVPRLPPCRRPPALLRSPAPAPPALGRPRRLPAAPAGSCCQREQGLLSREPAAPSSAAAGRPVPAGTKLDGMAFVMYLCIHGTRKSTNFTIYRWKNNKGFS